MSWMLGVDLDVVCLFQHGHQTHIEPLTTVGRHGKGSIRLQFEQTGDLANHPFGLSTPCCDLRWRDAGLEFE